MALALDKVLLFGDSITQYCYDPEIGFCFGSAMQNAYSRWLDVIKRGFGDYNSDHALVMVDKILMQETPPNSNIKFMVRSNADEMNYSGYTIFQHVPIARYKDNMRKIVTQAKNIGARVVVVGPAPYNYHQWRIGRGQAALERTVTQGNTRLCHFQRIFCLLGDST
ncbi:SGNH hydrolase-type esterase domain-containing protein [Lipomyces starkeyi]